MPPGTKTTVAIFIPSYRIGGAEKVLVLLANTFLQHFDRVQMLSTTADGPLISELDARVERIDLACDRYRGILLKLRKYFNEQKPDAVLTSIYATGIVAVAARSISRHKPCILIGGHNSFSAKLAAPDNAKDRYLLGPLSRFFLRRADVVVPVSHGVSDDLARTLHLPAEKLRVIYNPVVSPVLLESARADLAHPWLQDRSIRPFKTLLSVGRLVQQKGFDVLLRAFARLPHRNQQRLILVGDGPERQGLAALANDLGVGPYVDFHGYDSNPYRFMARADLFVLSSRWEGLPTVLIEAMACGCPVAATDCPYGPAEILEDGKYGKLARVEDPESLAQAILAALKSTPDAADGLAGMLAARTDSFTVKRATAEYVGLIEQLLARVADAR